MALPKHIRISDEGLKSLKKLDRHTKLRILNKLGEYEKKPDLLALNIKQLTDIEPVKCRIRIGDYRSLGTIQGETLVLHVFIHRRDL